MSDKSRIRSHWFTIREKCWAVPFLFVCPLSTIVCLQGCLYVLLSQISNIKRHSRVTHTLTSGEYTLGHRLRTIMLLSML